MKWNKPFTLDRSIAHTLVTYTQDPPKLLWKAFLRTLQRKVIWLCGYTPGSSLRKQSTRNWRRGLGMKAGAEYGRVLTQRTMVVLWVWESTRVPEQLQTEIINEGWPSCLGNYPDWTLKKYASNSILSHAILTLYHCCLGFFCTYPVWEWM